MPPLTLPRINTSLALNSTTQNPEREKNESNSCVCFHCLETIPKYGRTFAQIGGEKHAMCCHGCKSAAEFIYNNGLSGFYNHRERTGQTGFFANVARQSLSRTANDEWAFLDDQSDTNEYVSIDPHGRRRIDLMVNGLYCSSCSWLVTKAVKQLSQAIEVSVQLDTRRVTVVFDHEVASLKLSRVLQVINDLGYRPTPITNHSRLQDLDKQRANEGQQSIKRILVAGLGMMQVMTYAIALYLGELQGMDTAQHRFLSLVSMLVATAVVFYSGRPFFINAFNDLRNRHFGMDVPIAFAIAGAYFPSVYDTLARNGEFIYFDSAVMFIFFLLIGRFFEMRARHKLSDAPNALMRLLPTRVSITRSGNSELKKHSIKPQEVQIGDQTVLNNGNIVPFDAKIISGNATIDESILTGEVLPVFRDCGDPILAGSNVLNGTIALEATHTWANSSISRVENLLGQNLGSKSEGDSKLQKFSQVFIIGVLLLTTLVGLFWWFYDSSRVFEIVLAMLIASCPCAFALAIPVGTTAASNALRKHGVLLANSSALQTISQISTWCFDKTGTLTQGQTSLVRVDVLSELSETQCLNLAAAMEHCSRHPLSRAFSKIETPLVASDIREITGHGIVGKINDQVFYLGKRNWVLQEMGANKDISLPPFDRHHSEILLASEQNVLALLYISDELRLGAIETISFLKDLNKDVTILSGDTPPAVYTLANELAITNCKSGLLPEQKMNFIKSAQTNGYVLAMVGDGLNDTPVLAQANLSIALASGSELCQSQADVILLNGRLNKLIVLHQLAQASKRITTQNLSWALTYNAVILPLAAFGFLSPWVAALGMSCSSLLVVLNALRIRAQGVR